MRALFSAVVMLSLLWIDGRAAAAELAIVGARIYPAPDAEPIENGTVLVREGRIVAVGAARKVCVPKDATVIDGKGTVVTAGFWNSHVHLLPPPLREAAASTPAALDAALQAMFTRWGFTTIFDIASVPSGNAATLRRRIQAGELAGPMVLSVDTPFFPKDGTPVYVRDLLQSLGVPSAEVATVEEARDRARKQLAAGADGVKLFAGAIVGGERGVLTMDPAIATAVVEEAHRAGKPAFSHPTDKDGLEVSIVSGVDVLAHTTPVAGPWSDDLARRLVTQDIALTPTLSLFEVGLREENAPEDVVTRFVTTSQQQVGALLKAGGQILFGTDIGYIQLADTQREYELMAGAGMNWRQILASLTTAPAQRFKYADRKGRIAKGMDADLVVLAADPAQEAKAFSKVRYTIRDGKVIYRAASERASQEPASQAGSQR